VSLVLYLPKTLDYFFLGGRLLFFLPYIAVSFYFLVKRLFNRFGAAFLATLNAIATACFCGLPDRISVLMLRLIVFAE
jgi:ABC-type multidrug transport system permease subunit